MLGPLYLVVVLPWKREGRVEEEGKREEEVEQQTKKKRAKNLKTLFFIAFSLLLKALLFLLSQNTRSRLPGECLRSSAVALKHKETAERGLSGGWLGARNETPPLPTAHREGRRRPIPFSAFSLSLSLALSRLCWPAPLVPLPCARRFQANERAGLLDMQRARRERGLERERERDGFSKRRRSKTIGVFFLPKRFLFSPLFYSTCRTFLSSLEQALHKKRVFISSLRSRGA